MENLPETETIKKSTVKIQLNVEGMSCQAGCADGIDKMLKSKDGVAKSKTTFATGSSEIEYDEQLISEKEIIGLIENKGFKTAVKTENKQK